MLRSSSRSTLPARLEHMGLTSGSFPPLELLQIVLLRFLGRDHLCMMVIEVMEPNLLGWLCPLFDLEILFLRDHFFDSL